MDTFQSPAAFAVNNFEKRNEYLYKKYRSEIKDFDDWKKAVYFSREDEPVDLNDPGYGRFLNNVQRILDAQQRVAQQEQQQPKEAVIPEFFDEPKTGSGFIACPNNIIDEISGLEVLIGGKSAGNNSPEMVNEAANICQRLFQRGIMDITIYRGLIDELADGYYSD